MICLIDATILMVNQTFPERDPVEDRLMIFKIGPDHNSAQQDSDQAADSS